jgi:hypothetical protein
VALDPKRTAPLYYPTSWVQSEFGRALAVGDFDDDGMDDLAIGAPGEESDQGAVGVAMGREGLGLGETSYLGFEFGEEGVPGDPGTPNVRWGEALAAGDFDGDGASDLAVGSPHESQSALPSVGSATILYGSLFADGFEGLWRIFWSNVVP